MSSNDADQPKRPLLFEDAVRFLRTVADPGKCPICFAQAWKLPLAEWDSPITVTKSGLTFDGAPHYEVKMFCTTCGFVRSHSLAFIFSWLDQNPEEVSNSDE